MNKILTVILIIVALQSSAQVSIKAENNDYDYRNSVTQSTIVLKSCMNVVDTVEVYRGDEFVQSFVYVPGKEQIFKNLRAGKYYFRSIYFNDSVIVKADKIFIRNEHLKCEP